MRSRCDENGIVISPEGGKSQIFPDLAVTFKGNAQPRDLLQFAVQDLSRESIARNPNSQHTARPLLGFKYRHAYTVPGEKCGTREAGRAGTDNGHLLAGIPHRGQIGLEVEAHF